MNVDTVPNNPLIIKEDKSQGPECPAVYFTIRLIGQAEKEGRPGQQQKQREN